VNELQIFKNDRFGEIRTITEDDKTLFCGSDVAKALGYASPKDAILAHCKGAVKRRTLTNGGMQEMNFIPEGDIYRLAAKSELPSAEEFERWIFDEVLPSIRKHGAYMTPQKIEEVLLNPDTIIKLATALKEEQAKSLLLEQRVAEYEPKVQYLDQILQSKGIMATSQIAADYGMSAYKLNKILFEEHIQRKVNDQWILYREHMNLGYTKSETIPIVRSDGTHDTKLQTKWTQKGRLMIHNILTARGIQANIDKQDKTA